MAAVLEDWGLDAEAAVAWSRLTGRARRRLARRQPRTATWNEVLARLIAPDAELLAAFRVVLVRDLDAGVVMLDDWPREWIGQPIDVRDAPTRGGPVSCSVRWHGDRPALLWDGPADTMFTAPGLDPAWSSTRCPGRGAPRAVQPAGADEPEREELPRS